MNPVYMIANLKISIAYTILLIYTPMCSLHDPFFNVLESVSNKLLQCTFLLVITMSREAD